MIQVLETAREELQKMLRTGVELIEATVPILRFAFPTSKLIVDLSCSNGYEVICDTFP